MSITASCWGGLGALWATLAAVEVDARGAPVVIVTARPPEEALAALIERGASEPGADVRPWRLSELRARPPFLDGSGRVWACGSVPEVGIVDRIAAAELALGYSRLLEADDALDDALALAVCRSDLDVGELWRVMVLKGIVATYQEDPERAARAFEAARFLDPDRPWDEQYVDGKAAFEAARGPAPGTVRLAIVPDPGAVRVDGRPAAYSGREVVLAPGMHFVQLGDSAPITLRVEVQGRGMVTLVVPSLLTDDMLGWPAFPERWRDLDTVFRGLALASGETSPSFALYAPPDLWTSPALGSPYRSHAAPPVPPPQRKVPAWAWAAGGTSALSAAGAGVCAIGGLVARSAALSHVRDPYYEFAQAERAYHVWNGCLVSTESAALAGLVVAAVGFLHPVPVGPGGAARGGAGP